MIQNEKQQETKQKETTSQQLPQNVLEEYQPEYDYLDFHENEEKLKKLREQSRHYTEFLNKENNYTPSIADTPATNKDDLDDCFSNLNILLNMNKYKDE